MTGVHRRQHGGPVLALWVLAVALAYAGVLLPLGTPTWARVSALIAAIATGALAVALTCEYVRRNDA